MYGADGVGRDEIIQALVLAGAGGVHEDGDALATFVVDGTDLEFVRRIVERWGASLDAREIGEVDWSRAWTTQVGIQRIGGITVAPPWLAPSDDAGAVIIEPAMAFGTGEHPTTRGVIRLMQRFVNAGDVVADIGAGSAILSIAAIKLGAARAFAIELDADSIGNAEENVERNGVAHRIRVIEGDAAVLLPLVAPVRVVLANIISSVLVALSPVIRAALAPGGCAILSGILVSERADMLAALTGDGWTTLAEDEEGDWWSTAITPR